MSIPLQEPVKHRTIHRTSRLKQPREGTRIGHALRRAGRRCFDYLDPIEESRWSDPKERREVRKAFGRAFEKVLRTEESWRVSGPLEFRRYGPITIGGHDGMPYYIKLVLRAQDLSYMEWQWPSSCLVWIDFRPGGTINVCARDPRHLHWQTLYPRFRLTRVL